MSKWVQRKPRFKINKGTDLLSTLCNIRGIKVDESDAFLNPDKSVLFPASDMKNSDIAVERIIQAIQKNENIVVSADNDADGVTSTAIIIRYLRERMGKDIPYIFAQRDWGHGIAEQMALKDDTESNKERNENARRNHQLVSEADLLIIVDSSSNDVDACEDIVNNYGTDIIILDHHEINSYEKTMADIGVILVNPQQRGCGYINKSLSGAGVVWKIAGLVEELLNDGKIDTDKFMDLTAVGLSADMMLMDVLENRYIINHGLLNIHNMGLERIIKSSKGSKLGELDGDSIGFTIAPLINGTARMGNIQDAIELLLSDEDKEVKRIRLRMHRANEERKELQKAMSDKFIEDIDTSGKMIFIITEESSQGMNGLIAQELAQKFQRPVFVGRKSKDGMVMGSCRSYGGIQLKTFLDESGLVEFASGHEGALGLGFKYENYEDILNYVEEYMDIVAGKEQTFMYDVHLDSEKLADSIDLIVAFNHITGINCKKILVRVDNIMISDRSVIGTNKNTVKFTTMDELDLIKFRVDESYAEEISVMDSVSVIGEVKWNRWTKFKPVYEVIETMQIMLEDYRMEE